MKKIIQLGLVLSSALILSACGLQTKSNTQNNNSNQNQVQNQAQKFSLKDLISQGISQKCTWENNQDGQKSSGEMLIKGNKFNQTIKIDNPNGQTEFKSISDGQWLYTWSNDSTAGNMAFKTKLEDPKDLTNGQSDDQNSSGINWNQQYEFHCSPTVTTDADFQPPKDVQFQDYSKMMEDWQKLVPSMTVDSE